MNNAFARALALHTRFPGYLPNRTEVERAARQRL